MKNTLLTIVTILAFLFQSNAQQFITKSGNISFYSDGPLEKIEAHNNQVNSALNTESGYMVFKVLMKSFVFEKALMQEHFNENYVESDSYPNSSFKGKVINVKEIDFTKNGTYDVAIEGKLTIHGITEDVKEKGTFEVSKEGIHGMAKFDIAIADYNISIPGAVTGKIAEEIEISVNVMLKPYKK